MAIATLEGKRGCRESIVWEHLAFLMADHVLGSEALDVKARCSTVNEVTFRDYLASDKPACLGIFDANCPEFFSPNEREDYLRFLDTNPAGYEVCVVAGRLVGAFGVFQQGQDSVSLNWILIGPGAQGLGIGSEIMTRALASARSKGVASMQIAASHKSEPFFGRFGAVTRTVIDDGWGPGMHRIDMELPL